MRKGSEQNPNIEIENHRSLHDYIGRKNNDQLSERDKVIKSQFNLKLHDIQYFDCSLCAPLYDGMRIDPGELLILINKQYGFLWNTIPWGKMDEIFKWVINNHHKKTLLLQKDYHYTIMTSENGAGFKEYQRWFNDHELNISPK